MSTDYIQATNFIELIQSFKNKIFGYNYVLINDIRDIIINHLNAMILEGQYLDDHQFFDDEEHNLKEFCLYEIKELVPDLLYPHYEKLQKELTKSHSNLLNYVNDLNKISLYRAYNEFEGNPFEIYCQTLAEFILEDLEGTQDDYIYEQKIKAVQKIKTGFLNAYYSPNTELGIKRFDRKRKELFEDSI
jgi:hypothetical protein